MRLKLGFLLHAVLLLGSFLGLLLLLWSSLSPRVEEPSPGGRIRRENPELMETTDSTLLTEEGPNSVSQLARRVQGAGAKGWRTMSSLFSREDEDKLLPSEPCADHPLAAKPEEESPSETKTSGLWDVFASKWQQTSALDKMATKADTQEQMSESSGASGEMADEEASSAGHDNDLREAEGTAFKWSFLTSKLAEMKNKSN